MRTPKPPSAAPLPARLAAALQDELVPRTGRVVVALSGGLDSVVLLHLLRFPLAGRYAEPVAASYDHRMRQSSTADALWVRGLCRSWGVSLVEGAAETPPASEAEARRLRYAFLRDAAEGAGASRVLTAHHADDQAETVLFRLLRGAGTRGLAGIPERRGIIVRPLLGFRRRELERYAHRNRVAYRVDPTNLDPGYARNLIRHWALPWLERAAPGTTDALLELAGAARAMERAWKAVETMVLDDVVKVRHDRAIHIARQRLLAYDSQVVARVVRRMLRRFGSSPGRAGTRAALEFITSGASGGRIPVAGGVEIARDFDRIRIGYPPGSGGPDRPLRIGSPGPDNGRCVAGGRPWAVEWAPREEPRDRGVNFGLDGLRFPLTMRGWAPGDRIRLTAGTKKLKEVFREHRVPVRSRGRIPVLVNGDGEVLWVVGVVRGASAPPAHVGNLEVRADEVDDA